MPYLDINDLMEVNRHQLEMAMELTKIIIDKSPNSSMKEEEILSIFKRASQTIMLSSPVKELWKK